MRTAHDGLARQVVIDSLSPDRFYGDFAIGLGLHNGTLEVQRSDFPSSPGATELERLGTFLDFLETKINIIDNGPRVLFRPQLTLGYRINHDWAVEGYLEHIRHGGLLSNGPNDGSDSAGIRMARRF